MMKIAAIDYSINSPGICKFVMDDKLEIVEKDYLSFTQSKTYKTDKIKYFGKKDFNNNYDQMSWMNDEIFKFLDVPTLEYVALEDYAYSATGKIFNIAEGCGFLKISLYHSGKKIRLQSPNSIKLWATGYGNCDKIRMEQSYDIRKDAFDLSFLPRVVDKKSNNPKDNIVDAFFICDLLRHELMLRKGLIKLSDLTEKQIQVFNSVSKTFPENILCRDFLEKKI